MIFFNKFGFTYLSYKSLYSFQTLKLFILFRLVDPLMHYLFFAALASSVVGTDYLKYVVVGNIAYYTSQTIMINFMNMFRLERRYGTLELNIASPEPTILIIFRKAIVPLLDGLFVFAAGLLIGSLIFGIDLPLDQTANLLLIFIAILFSVLSFSLLFASISLLFSNVNLFLNLSLAFFQIFCGVNFSAALLPAPLEAFARLLPLTHGIEALRAIYGLEAQPVYHLLAREVFIGIGYLFIGILMVFAMEKIARRNGALFRNI
ncbi:ABC transporter permease [Bacillus infantis]|uniref:ABC transporter permease n=1 Tax=Bacillus infantis TaxID=324767 RepID=A0A5D4RJR1_9BACI|nr:ABC transporter permease [Bacillus infantis]TYS51170.1 ABC transporter permease [Bacillus infantis]